MLILSTNDDCIAMQTNCVQQFYSFTNISLTRIIVNVYMKTLKIYMVLFFALFCNLWKTKSWRAASSKMIISFSVLCLVWLQGDFLISSQVQLPLSCFLHMLCMFKQIVSVLFGWKCVLFRRPYISTHSYTNKTSCITEP